MKTNVLPSSLMLLLLAIPALGQSTDHCRATVGKDANGKLEVTLENRLFLARYAIGPGGRKGQEWAIRDLIIKSAKENQAGRFIDACATRGFLTRATVTRDDPSVKTVRMTFDDDHVQDVSIYKGKPWLKIEYISYGVNTVDIGSPGGVSEGRYEIHGAGKWRRKYVIHPKSYYNRFPADKGKENVKEPDPSNGGPLSYKGYFIMGVYNPKNRRGFGRVAPVSRINIIKLLWNRGFELFPNLGGDKKPYTAYLFVNEAGSRGIVTLGKRIVDEVARCEEGIGGPRPGDVWREFNFAKWFSECDPDATHGSARKYAERARQPREITASDLAGVVRAEVSVQYWGGHIGTFDQKFSVNGSGWFQIPQPMDTPTEPQCYYRTVLGDNAVEIPPGLLKEGKNVFTFGCGKQIRHGFRWGFFWIYSFNVRVYYGPGKAHATGRVVLPSKDLTIGDSPVISAVIDPAGRTIKQVDFIALYDDFDWEGNGLFRQWHYQYRDGQIARHLGTATKAPYSIKWDTKWVPDQDRPISIMARIVDDQGLMSMTPAVENVKFKRAARSVRMYRASEIPENFGVRIGKRKSCAIQIGEDPGKARSAVLVLSSWSAEHAEEIGINGTKLVDHVGVVHDYSYDFIPVPLKILRKGRNEFHIFSNTKEHSAEVNWPGPVLLLEFPEAAKPESAPAGSSVPAARTRPATSVPKR